MGRMEEATCLQGLLHVRCHVCAQTGWLGLQPRGWDNGPVCWQSGQQAPEPAGPGGCLPGCTLTGVGATSGGEQSGETR